MVGIDGSAIISAIQPFVNGTWDKLHSFIFHVFHGIGELVFAFLTDIIIDKELEFAVQGFTAFEVVDSDDG